MVAATNFVSSPSGDASATVNTDRVADGSERVTDGKADTSAPS
jgi:hypothetical protein